MTEILAIITPIIVGILTLCGVVYTSNKQYSKQQADSAAAHLVLKTELEEYKKFLHEVNKGLKEDIKQLSDRVSEHNDFGRKIPVMEKQLENMEKRIEKLEEM